MLLPANLRIVPPGPDVPQEIAALSGKWAGKWGGVLAHVLVVEEIAMAPPRAVVHAVYAFGANPPALSTPGWGRVRGLIAEGQLRLTSPGGATVIYRMASIDTLEAFYDPQGFRPLYARMQRMKD